MLLSLVPPENSKQKRVVLFEAVTFKLEVQSDHAKACKLHTYK